MGFLSSAGIRAWLAVLGILVMFTLALTWTEIVAGSSAKSVEGASAFSYPLMCLVGLATSLRLIAGLGSELDEARPSRSDVRRGILHSAGKTVIRPVTNASR